jgi:hypothetical protein
MQADLIILLNRQYFNVSYAKEKTKLIKRIGVFHRP